MISTTRNCKTRLIALAASCMLAPAALAQQEQGVPGRKPSAVQTPQGQVRSAPEDESEIFKLYDMSGLGGLLSAPNMPPGTAEAQMVRAFADAFSLHVSPIGTSMFLIGATRDDHDKIAALMLQMKATTAERFRVQMMTVSAPTDKAPAVGAAIEVGSMTGTRIDHVVQQRTSAMFESKSSQTYIADWQPVVGNDTVGYQPMSKSISSGLEAKLFIGGGDGESIDVRIEGEISRADIKSIELPLAAGGAKLTIGLPVREQRSVHADAHVKLGEAMVISVSNGFEPGTSLITAIRVEKAR